MALLSVIRHWHFRDHLSICEIAKRNGPSRNTIRKYLRLDTGEPRFNVSERSSKLGPFAERQSAWLKARAGAIAQEAVSYKRRSNSCGATSKASANLPNARTDGFLVPRSKSLT